MRLNPNYFYFILFILAGFRATSQTIDQQKVNNVHSFSNNISWPNEKDEYVLKVITQKSSLITVFKEFAENRQINGKPIKISFSDYVTVPETLDILYISSQYSRSLPAIIDGIKGKPVLIITEQSADQQYIMINLISTPSGLSFEYNRANIINQNLDIADFFDELGGNEISLVGLYQKARDSVNILEQRSGLLKEQIDTLNMLTAVAFKVGNTLFTQMAEQQTRLDNQIEMLDSLTQALRDREAQLSKLASDISIQEDNLREGERQLGEQAALIDQRDQVIQRKDNQLKGIVTVLNSQQEILILLIVFALFFLLALFIAYKAYQAKIRDAKKLNEQKEELDELLEKLQFTQEQLVLSERLAVVGELTDSFANEVNNAINYIYSGIHVIKEKFNEMKPIMANIKTLNNDDSDLKMKVREIVNQKNRIEFDAYPDIINTMVNSILIGADRILSVLKDLKPYSQYGELGRVGLALLGRRVDDNNSENRSSSRLLRNRSATAEINSSTLK